MSPNIAFDLAARALQQTSPDPNAFTLAVEAWSEVHDGTIVTGLSEPTEVSPGVLRFEVEMHALLESPDSHAYRVGRVVETANATHTVIVCAGSASIEVAVKTLPA